MRVLLRLHVGLAALLVPLLVRLLPLRVLLVLMRPPAWVAPYRLLGPYTVAAMVRARLLRPRMMRRRRCLRLGLMLYHFLRLAGSRPVFLLAAYAPPGKAGPVRTFAHCWVTVDGRAISSPAKPPYAMLLKRT